LNNYNYYAPSGKIDPVRSVISYAIGIAIAIVLGYAYSILTAIIPIIYANIILCFAVGGVLAFLNRFLFRLSNNRSIRSQIIHAIVLALVVNYVQWTTYVIYIFSAEVPSLTMVIKNLTWIFQGTDFFGAISEINTYGSWSLFGGVVKGFLLTGVWLVEFLIIMVIPLISAFNGKVYPFSETQNKWYKKYTLRRDFQSIASIENLQNGFAADPTKTIEDLGLGNANRYTKIHIFHLPNESNQYISFEKTHIDHKGNKIKDIVINNLKIDEQTAKTIMANFENAVEKLDIF